MAGVGTALLLLKKTRELLLIEPGKYLGEMLFLSLGKPMLKTKNAI